MRLHEKGGKRHEIPAHHKLEGYLDEYIKAAGLDEKTKSALRCTDRFCKGAVRIALSFDDKTEGFVGGMA